MNYLIKFHRSEIFHNLVNISAVFGSASKGNRYSGYMLCCGVKEISGLRNLQHLKNQAAIMTCVLARLSRSRIFHRTVDWTTTYYFSPREMESTCCAHMIFTQAGANARYGYKFAEFIRQNRLGRVTVSVGSKNPNSDNIVRVFTWTLNQDAVMTWWNTQVEEYCEWLVKQHKREAAEARIKAKERAILRADAAAAEAAEAAAAVEEPAVYDPILMNQIFGADMGAMNA